MEKPKIKIIGCQGKFDKATRDLAKQVADELGVSSSQLLGNLERNVQRVAGMRKSDVGKYRVLGIDKFDGGDWVHGEYDSADEALREARKMTRGAMESASDSHVATVYYAYDPKGGYLGGDTWNLE
ncbi:MAG: hypothetical protein Q7J54_05205 [Candidatus Woesearchaeota archaeon]|nr:hypothetical protein [Candidatus Woesearchaeota archaeon]